MFRLLRMLRSCQSRSSPLESLSHRRRHERVPPIRPPQSRPPNQPRVQDGETIALRSVRPPRPFRPPRRRAATKSAAPVSRGERSPSRSPEVRARFPSPTRSPRSSPTHSTRMPAGIRSSWSFIPTLHHRRTPTSSSTEIRTTNSPPKKRPRRSESRARPSSKRSKRDDSPDAKSESTVAFASTTSMLLPKRSIGCAAKLLLHSLSKANNSASTKRSHP